MRYRPAVELHRAHRGAGWTVAGVWLGDAFFPAPGGSRAGMRAYEAGLAAVVPLALPVVAPSDRAAAAIAARCAAEGAWEAPEAGGGRIGALGPS